MRDPDPHPNGSRQGGRHARSAGRPTRRWIVAATAALATGAVALAGTQAVVRLSGGGTDRSAVAAQPRPASDRADRGRSPAVDAAGAARPDATADPRPEPPPAPATTGRGTPPGPPPTPPPATGGPASPTATPERTVTTAPTQSSAEDQVVAIVNQERARAGCRPVTVDPRLAAAAAGHSADMAAKDYFSHDSPDGRSAAERVLDAGYRWSTTGENIAKGQRTPQAVMEAWMDSPGHRQNILNCRFANIGVGLAFDGRTPIWTQEFGTLR